MWRISLTSRKVRRIELLLAGATDPSRRKYLEERLDAERLKLLGPNAATVDPARLFHGSCGKSDDGSPRRFN
jgi:hypothetical protein